jgi:hypothetical protein
MPFKGRKVVGQSVVAPNFKVFSFLSPDIVSLYSLCFAPKLIIYFIYFTQFFKKCATFNQNLYGTRTQYIRSNLIYVHITKSAVEEHNVVVALVGFAIVVAVRAV